LTESQDDVINRAARLIAGALTELTAATQKDAGVTEELARHGAALEAVRQHLEQHLAEDRQHRALLAEQIANLAASLDRLVTHLEGISLLMSDLVGRLGATGAASEPAVPADTGEPPFRPGGEGISLGISEVPGFQVLMEIQKALMAMDPVSSASVERFQEGESRIQVHLRSPVTGLQLASALGSATGHSFAVEESKPELMSLKLKVVG